MSVTYREENNIGCIELDLEGSKVNLLTAAVFKELDSVLETVKTKTSLDAVVLISKKKDVFIAGADIKEIEQITDPRDGERKSKAGQDILNKLEDLKIPAIAVIDGVALGGGCELALACQYRLATFNEKVKIGLPEVNLGILPGFGGTYRLPRLIGLAEGLKMILNAKPVDSRKALRLGLVDRLVPQVGIEGHILNFIRDVYQGKIQADKYSRRKLKGLAVFEESLITQGMIFAQSRKSVLQATKGFYPAPFKAIRTVQKNFYEDRRDKGMDIEAMAFGELAATDISKNLIKVFHLCEKYRRLKPEGAEGIVPAPVHKCGVLGAGVMGGGIAQLLSSKGIAVRLKDIHYEALALGLLSANKIVQDGVKKRRISENEAVNMMARITPTLDYSGFANADMVIEAVVEHMDIKKNVFSELNNVTAPATILATNTSALSVAEMAEGVGDPSRVVGIHFFNPVHRMPLVEVIKTPATSHQTLAAALEFARRLGKTPIVVKDSCGFLVNRILLGYINEAGRLLEEGGRMEVIDKIMTDFGMPMGPFALSDEVGLDVGIKVLHILEQEMGERFKPVRVFESIQGKGLLGKKGGKGFYLHGKKRVPNPEIEAAFRGASAQNFDARDAIKRMLYIMINEAAQCLNERVVDDPGAVDVGMILGTGFPAFHGGLLRYADFIGVANIVDDLSRLERRLQAGRFAASNYLLTLKKEKRDFYDVLC
jgi:3-hydroxyacyl-CoA dehydrogenase/enoyl-CoA hydratase/3-hydroxybutyryl-CoA epimerase